jgi:hypothetical protein
MARSLFPFNAAVPAALLAAVFLTQAPLFSLDDDLPESGEDPAASGDARAFLDNVEKLYSLPFRHGLNSFGMEIRLLDTGAAGNDRLGDDVSITYDWEAPGLEDIVVGGVSDDRRRSVRDPLHGIWKDIAGGGVFPDLDGEALSLEIGEENIVVKGPPDGDAARIVRFDRETKKAVSVESAGSTMTIATTPAFTTVEGLFHLESKVVTVTGKGGGATEGAYLYGGFRKIGGYTLPTLLAVNVGAVEVEFELVYAHINGEKPEDAAFDPAVVKEMVRNFEKAWSKLSSLEKIDAMKALASTRHELAAASIARKGLKDRDPAVREDAAKFLGRMKCRNTVPLLIKAMKPNERIQRVSLAIIASLGSIGDPKAVPALSKNLWSQKDSALAIVMARARIDALGMIRSKKSVEALIDMMYVAGTSVMKRISGNLVKALVGLTEQRFGRDRGAWKNWWKKNRSKFKLEEDR